MEERWLERREESNRTNNRLGNHISSIVVNGALLWVMNALPGWNIPYLLSTYTNALPAITLSLTVQLALSGVLVFYRPRFLYHLTSVVSLGFGVYALSAIIGVFPVDFSSIALPSGMPSLNSIVRIVLNVVRVGYVIGAVVHGIKFLARVVRGDVDR